MADPAGIQKVWRLPLADAWAGKRALWWTVGPDGELAVLLVQRRQLHRTRYSKGWIGWRPVEPFDAELVTITDQGEQRKLLAGIPYRPSHLAVLPAGRLLLVEGRTFRQTEDSAWEPNAAVYGPDGKPTDSFCIGDDIPALVTDRSGGIWTAYGDEGIYGGHPESQAGLAGWDMQGRAIWSPQGRLPDWPLEGCTAATEGEHVWLVWYSGTGSGTSLTRITPSTGAVTSWRSPVFDPDGFAVSGNRAILTRRKHNRRTVELVQAELRGGEWQVTGRRRLRMPGRVVMRCGQGRDGFLWLRAGDTWVRIAA